LQNCRLNAGCVFRNYFSITCLAIALNAGDKIPVGQYLLSPKGCFQAILQFDGNFVVYRMLNMAGIWATMALGIFMTCYYECRVLYLMLQNFIWDLYYSKIVITKASLTRIN